MTKSSKTTPRTTLREHAARVAAEVDFADQLLPGAEYATLDDYLADPTREEILTNVSVSTLLVMTMIQDAATPSDLARIAKCSGTAMVVRVPTSDYVEPVARALGRIADCDVIKRTGSSKTQDKPESGTFEVADALAAGRNAIGVSQAPERYLPASLVSGADIRIDMQAPSNEVLRAVLRFVTMTEPGELPPDLARGLTLDTVVSCIRRGSTAAECVGRLAAARKAASGGGPALADVPLLGDMHGLGEAGVWGLALVEAIQEFKSGKRLWSSIEGRNIVLCGDAGTGKTTFARSLAKTAGLPFFPTSVSSWFSSSGHLNDVIRAFDAVIAQAVAAGPSVILLDEIDSIPSRATLDSRNRDYWTPLVSHILLSLDSAVSGSNGSLVVVGATNFPERLDEALVRPGRLDRIVRIERPDQAAIAGILRQHLGDDLPGEDLEPLAAIGIGASGAEVAGWARGARMAARAAGREMRLPDLLGQLAPPETRPRKVLLAVARHESAHSVAVERLLCGSVRSVSLVQRGRFAGRTNTVLANAEAMTRDQVDALVVATLAGRAADEHWDRATSASAGSSGSDLAVATGLVAGKHGTWGLGGTLAFRGDQSETIELLQRDRVFLDTVQSDLDRLYALAVDFVRTHADVVDKLAHRLLARRVLGGDDVRAIIAAAGRSPVPEDDTAIGGGIHG